MIRLGAVGDVVRTLPAVSALRVAKPRAQIEWLVEPPAASVLFGQPAIDAVCEFPRARLASHLRARRYGRLAREVREFVAALRARRFDLVLDFHSILRSGVLSALTGAPLRVGFAPPFGREFSHYFANHLVRLPDRKISRFERNAALVRFLGVSWAPLDRPLSLRPEAIARMANCLPRGAPPVAIHPGTSESTPHKRYTIEGYRDIAMRLAEEVGVPCVVTCGPARGEAEFANAVVASAGGAARRAPATPTLGDLAALFAACRLVIGSDTGPLHVASLVGTPVVQLLGPTDPIENAPWEATPSRSLRAGLACSPCRRGCAAATCMRTIAPEAVVAAALELVAHAPLSCAAAGGRDAWT